MAVSTDQASTPTLEQAEKDRPARELVVAFVFGPLSRPLVQVLLPLRVPPPAVVLANATAGVGAAVVLASGRLAFAAALLQLKTLVDNADGLLARASGRVTRLGRYLDTEADLVVNAAVFAALGYETSRPWLAALGFVAATLLLGVGFNLAELHREAHGRRTDDPPALGGSVERGLERIYAAVYAWQDRAIRDVSERRLARVLAGEDDLERRRRATLAYHDRLTFSLLANTGLSTQLFVLGACLVAGVPSVYLGLVVAAVLALPLLQLRREALARRALAASDGSA
jgi:archaetidylinositol phosphate synthase